MIKYLVDTNIILDKQNLFWEEIFKDDETGQKFVIQQVVIEELNGIKDNNYNNKGYIQRKQLQKLYLQLEYNRIEFIQDIKNNFDQRFTNRINDNIIINTQIELQNENPNEKIILYTNDLQLILKCKLYNIEVYTDIEKVDITNIKQQIPKFILKEEFMEELINTIEQNRFSDNELSIDLEDLKEEIIGLDKPIEDYFINSIYQFITNETEDIKYIIRQNKITTFNENNYKINKIHDFNIILPEQIQHYYIPQHLRNHFNMIDLFPKTNGQTMLLDSIFNKDIKIITSLSQSGTGKTLLQLYGQINLVLNNYNLNGINLNETLKKEFHKIGYNKIIFIVNPSSINHHKELGYLPGDKHSKILPYMQGVIDNLNFIFNDEIPQEFDIVSKEKDNFFEIRPLSYIRGSSINNQIVIVDEIQNLTIHEIRSLISRISSTSKLILLGDINQIDEQMQVDYVGIVRLINLFSKKNKELPFWSNVTLDKQIRSDIINILSDEFFNVI